MKKYKITFAETELGKEVLPRAKSFKRDSKKTSISITI